MSSSRAGLRGWTLDRLLLVAVAALIAWAALLLVTGGLDLRPFGVRLRSRDPFRPACVAFALLLVYATRYRTEAARQFATLAALDERFRATRRLAPVLAALLSFAIVSIGVAYGTYVAGSADSYGYVSQARLWLTGTLTQPQPLARALPWPNADWTLSPLGYRPAPSGGAIVPSYAAGLPLLMALAQLAFGDCGPYLVVPCLGGLAVWLTYRLGARLGSDLLGLGAATLLAASPAFLFMLMWPMTDVPITTFVVAALLLLFPATRGRTLASGVAMSGAVLVRPNLVPLLGVFGLFILLRARDWRTRLRDATWFAAGSLPGVAIVAMIQARLYGAPWRSGYGNLDSLYAWRHGATNLVRYGRWLFETQTPLIAAALLPLRLARRGPTAAPGAFALCGAVTGVVWLVYLFYLPFDEWWYLRFLLAAFPCMLLLAIVGWRMLVRRASAPLRAVLVGGLWLTVLGYEIGVARDHPIFNLRLGQTTYLSAADFIERHLPRNAVLVTMQQSGSVRHYTGRLTLRYDWLEPDWWPRALDVLVARGYRPYVLLEPWEEPLFRARFHLPPATRGANATDPIGAIIAERFGNSGLRIYDPLVGRPGGRVTTPSPPVTLGAVESCPCPW